MKRILLFAALAALMLSLPAVSSAKRGDKAKAGTVTAYDAATGELTLTTLKGRAVTALVDDDTRVSCDGHFGRISTDDDDDDGDDRGRGRGRDHSEDDDDFGDDDRGRGRGRDDDDDDDSRRRSCDVDDLAVGVEVRKARIDFDDGEAVWEKLKL